MWVHLLERVFAALSRVFSALFAGLQSHSLVGEVASAVVTAIGLLHLAVFFLPQVADVCRELPKLFG